jgi:hypothetical protein
MLAPSKMIRDFLNAEIHHVKLDDGTPRFDQPVQGSA